MTADDSILATSKRPHVLVIDWTAEYSDEFEVEITKLPAETSSVKIDVSPVDPDCTGGHEFIRYSK